MRNGLVALLFLLSSLSIRATLLFDLDSPIQTAAPGGIATFTGTLFNDDVVDVYLNGASANLPYSELTVDLPGDYFGSFTIQGGPDDVTVDDLATQNFQISISSVPEPSSGALLGLCLLMLGCAQCWRGKVL